MQKPSIDSSTVSYTRQSEKVTQAQLFIHLYAWLTELIVGLLRRSVLIRMFFLRAPNCSALIT